MQQVPSPLLGVETPSALRRHRVWPPWAMALLLVLAVLLAYSNSLHSPFTYDDYCDVLDQYTIRHLWPLRDVLILPGKGWLNRPLVTLSFALNYAFGGVRPFGFHLVNLAVHLLASLTLLGVVRRTLLLPCFQERFKDQISALALGIAALWALHPLVTESVSYITQRYESVVSLLILATFYAFLRSLESRKLLWQVLAVLACALALQSKEIAVSLPLLVLCFDRAFVAGSFRGAMRERRWFYLGLVLTWLPFLYVQLHAAPRTFAASGYTMPWWKYALNQPRVVLHYLRMVIWPHPLVFDYFWQPTTSWKPLAPGIVAALVLLGFTIWAFFKRPRLAFLPLLFLAILAPTSSVMPILDLAVEHRMYLPLVPALVALVLVVHAGLRVVRERWGARLAWMNFLVAALFAAILATLGILTYLRNEDYKDPLDLWYSVILASPHNPRGHNNYAYQLIERGRLQEAIQEYGKAVQIAPGTPLFESNYGLSLGKAGRYQEGLEHLRIAVQRDPGTPAYLDNLGVVLLMKGSVANAEICFQTALGMDSKDGTALAGMSSVMQAKRDLPQAKVYILRALEADPYNPGLWEQKAYILSDLGDREGARAAFRQTLRAMFSAEKICSLAWAIHQRGYDLEALAALDQVDRMVPGHLRARMERAWILAASADAGIRNGAEAARLAQGVLEAQQGVRTPEILDLVAVAYASAGRFEEAVALVQEGLSKSKDQRESWVPILQAHLALFSVNKPVVEAPYVSPAKRGAKS
nr:tetratricopeptide repeat protein [uncultured Holophaga sp.]